ncbi:MAG: family transcriptional regulator [Cypionkella sp.]|uniref:helix-turn-helix domain-containing protein n=1 Tax=Cypionkella sp. TaxID=2811411 RepID=UPI002612D05A|nr:helix-turn-helix transcriptional regulator [Cypionkella sp.]MDB5660356.1 family transcriptional regulator [Cypionkella sp.]
MTKPHQDTALAKFVQTRILQLKPKTQAEIAHEAGFHNANVLSMIRSGSAKMPLDRVPTLAHALDCDPALLLRLALDQAVGSTAANAIVEIFGTPVSANERAWIEEIRSASKDTDPRITTRSRTALRGIFGK